MTSTFFKGVVSVGLALGGGAAFAQPVEVSVVGERPDEMQLTERVPYGDLDLVTAAGQKDLNSRVRRATRNVCAPFDPGSYRLQNQACRSEAWQGAKPQIALATKRAQQIALTGHSSIPAVAITVVAPSRF